MAAIDWAELALNHWGKFLSAATLLLSLLGYGNVHQFLHGQEVKQERDNSEQALTSLSTAINKSTSRKPAKTISTTTYLQKPCNCKKYIDQHEKGWH